MTDLIMHNDDRSHEPDQPMRAAEGRPDARLTELAVLYARLQRRLAAVTQVRAGRVQHGAIDELEAQADTLLGQMYDAAWCAAVTGAETLAGLEAKARILADWCEESSTDVGHALTASLCADVQRVCRASVRKQ